MRKLNKKHWDINEKNNIQQIGGNGPRNLIPLKGHIVAGKMSVHTHLPLYFTRI